MAAQITTRALNPQTWDAQWGQGQNNFLTDREAVAQMIVMRLKLLRGEWFENPAVGVPYFQQILGQSGSGTIYRNQSALVIQQTILQTPYVTGISSLTLGYQSGTRNLLLSCIVQTQFGAIALSNQSSASGTIANV